METENKYPRVTPEQRDHMPREVATEHLCNPKSRLSGAFRRACQRARETVYTSAFPIRWGAENNDGVMLPWDGSLRFSFRKFVPEDKRFRVYDTPRTPKTAETRFNAKLRGFSWARLHQILWRCNTRSDRMFAASQKALTNTKLSEKARMQLAEHFQAQAGKFDFLHGLTTAEIARRVAIVTINKAKHEQTN